MTILQSIVPSVRKADPTDAYAVSSALAAAFYNDPIFRWVMPDDSVRTDANRAFFDLVVTVLARHDEAWTSVDGVTGAALWVPPGSPLLAEEHADQFVSAAAGIDGVEPDRMVEILALLDDHHPAEPHEYLFFLGVVPYAQGRGIGSALMAPVLERADRAGARAYLDATSPRNRALYERHGFRASAPISVVGGPPLWPMWRDPA
jgi:ribosomal protein S18 acetylase RimI-like enzyme